MLAWKEDEPSFERATERVGNSPMVIGGDISPGRQLPGFGVAERSTLYWAWWRRNRSTHDRSHGWGGNSQWRTDFRRDYRADGQLFYNVDAAHRVDRADSEDLPLDDLLELLRYRCGTVRDYGPEALVWYTHWSEPIPRRA